MPAFLLFLIALVALYSSYRALRALRRMNLLTLHFWKEQGLRTFYLLLTWLLLLSGAVGMLVGQAWGFGTVRYALYLLLGFVIFSEIVQIGGLSGMMRTGVFHRPRVSVFNLEILQRTGLSFLNRQNIKNFRLNEQDFFVFGSEPLTHEEEAEEALQGGERFDGHIRKYLRNQLIAGLINIGLAAGLVWFTLSFLCR